MSESREQAEHVHDRIKLQALDVVENALAPAGMVLDQRDRYLISVAVEAGIVAGIEWMTGGGATPPP
jgi:hypothetical protein